MSTSIHDRQVIQWKVADLAENPLQHQLFDDLPDDQLAELAEDMNANGQREPIVILPTGEIIDGHQRRRAAEILGWDTVAVVVRHDLAEADSATIESTMIGANLHRRQLDPLAIARLYRRLRQAQEGREWPEFYSADRADLRDRLAARLGTRSGRTLDRYLRLLDAPLVVQRCVSRGELPMQTALKVLRLQPHEREAIAAAIEAGQPAKAVIAAYLPTPRASRPVIAPIVEAPVEEQHEPSTLSIATQPAIRITDSTGQLQGVLDSLSDAVEEVVHANLPTQQKKDVIVEATTLFDALLDSAEFEAGGELATNDLADHE